jgi:hypothetical protein
MNRHLQAQLLRPQRRKWHKSLALEGPLLSPKGAAYRHDPDVDLRPAVSIKFRFIANAGLALRRSSRGHRAVRRKRHRRQV